MIAARTLLAHAMCQAAGCTCSREAHDPACERPASRYSRPCRGCGRFRAPSAISLMVRMTFSEPSGARARTASISRRSISLKRACFLAAPVLDEQSRTSTMSFWMNGQPVGTASRAISFLAKIGLCKIKSYFWVVLQRMLIMPSLLQDGFIHSGEPKLTLRSPFRTISRDPEAMTTIGPRSFTVSGSQPNGWWRAHQRPATPGSLTSEVGVEGVLYIHGEDAQAQRVGHFAEQLHRSSWIGLSGVERRALLLTDYDPEPRAFRRPSGTSRESSAWNTAQPVRPSPAPSPAKAA